MQKGAIVFIAALTVLLSACATDKLTAETMARIKAITVSRNVKVMSGPNYRGAKENAAEALFGIVGQMEADNGNWSKSDLLAKEMQANKIDVRHLLYRDFVQALGTREGFAGKLTRSGGDATITFVIQDYGLEMKNPFSGKVEPRFVVNATMRDAQGHELWHDFSMVKLGSYAYFFRKYQKDPQLLVDGFHAVVSTAVTRLMGSLKINGS